LLFGFACLLFLAFCLLVVCLLFAFFCVFVAFFTVLPGKKQKIKKQQKKQLGKGQAGPLQD
jgi:Tfp pilus assembly protein PilO